MNRQVVCLAMGMIVAGVSHAEAKTINMGVLSRNEVKSACERAGARHYGIENLDGGYGCISDVADVICTVDNLCHASIGDTRPMTGNSLDYVLTYGKAIPPATKVLPLDRRVESTNPPPKTTPSTGCFGLAAGSPGCAGEPQPE